MIFLFSYLFISMAGNKIQYDDQSCSLLDEEVFGICPESFSALDFLTTAPT